MQIKVGSPMKCRLSRRWYFRPTILHAQLYIILIKPRWGSCAVQSLNNKLIVELCWNSHGDKEKLNEDTTPRSRDCFQHSSTRRESELL